MDKSTIVPVEVIGQRIILLRGQRVILDSDLAIIYGVTTKRLNEQVRRNKERFPEDFVFQLSKEEKEGVVAICDHLKNLRFSPTHPYAFTEHGAIMAANVLKGVRAVRMSVYVVRAFVKLRDMLATHKELAQKLMELERKVGRHDGDIQTIIQAIRQLMKPPRKSKRQIGFRIEEAKVRYRTRQMTRFYR